MFRLWITARTTLGAAIALGCCTSWLVCGCGPSQDWPTRQNQSLGQSKEGAPLVAHSFDPGILQDPVSYLPSKTPTEATVPKPEKAAAKTGGDVDNQIKAAINRLIKALEAGNVEQALACFNPEQVAPLTETEPLEVLGHTFERLETLQRFVLEKFKPEGIPPQSLVAAIQETMGVGLKWDVLEDGQNAVVEPNLAVMLLGPAAAEPSIRLSLQGDQWKFQLPAPLDEADVEQVLAFHRQLQQMLDNVIDYVDRSKTIDPQGLMAALMQMSQGQQLELPSLEPEAAEAGDKQAGAPTPETKPAGRSSKGALRRPPKE